MSWRAGSLACVVLVGCGLNVVGASSSTTDGGGESSGGTIDSMDAGGSGTSPSNNDGASADGGVDGTTFDVGGPESSTSCTADINTSLDHCGGCFAACPLGSTMCKGGKCLATLRIRVGIDGESYFRFVGAQARWHHVVYAAPGRHPDTPIPLQLNGQTFNPTWPDANNDPQNYSCNCDSSVMAPVPAPPLPAKAQAVSLEVIAFRKALDIFEQPSTANGYQLSVHFLDVGVAGSGYYEALLTYESR